MTSFVGMREAVLCLAFVISMSERGAATDRVDVALVLASDVSNSMDHVELDTQRAGVIAAFRNPALLQAVRLGVSRRIAVAYVEWAGVREERLVVPWMIVDDRDSADAFANQLAAAPPTRGSLTSISAGLMFAAAQFRNLHVQADRMTIDVSGDGANNSGPSLVAARDRIVEWGITINGLPLGQTEPNLEETSSLQTNDLATIGLDTYFAECVIGGVGAFTMPITYPSQFFAAIQRKLILEIASRPASVILAGYAVPLPSPAYCETKRAGEYSP